MLRQTLQNITEIADGSEQKRLLVELNLENPNTIQVVDSPHPVERYPCLVHAFGLIEQPEYVEIAQRPFNRVAYASPEFVHWLLDRGLLQEVSGTNARPGDLVLYFAEDGRVKHAGIYLGEGRVLSKWGLGYLYNHAVFEVPTSYGNTVKYFTQPTVADTLLHFKEFAREKGILFL